MKCPGQDKAYWKGERVFDLPCPRCGSTVEFFRDENARRCVRCGYRFNNARVALDCTAWCDQAEACLGIARPRGSSAGEADTALAGRMIQAMEDALPDDPAKVTRALLVFQHAKDLVATAGVNAQVVLPAALLLEIDEDLAKQILTRAGLDEETIDSVSALVADCRDAGKAETPQRAVLRDSQRLARLVQEGSAGDPERLDAVISREIQTDAAKARARSLFAG